jgi:CheY-like chemotaxis protein
MLRALKDNFEFHGYKSLTAEDGEDGLTTALNAKPDLIVLDIMLPDIDGYEVCRTLRKSTRTSHIPVIFLTQKRRPQRPPARARTGRGRLHEAVFLRRAGGPRGRGVDAGAVCASVDT